MKKIVVMSDTHGDNEAIEQILLANPRADLYLHCGDIAIPEGTYPQILVVKGNNDYFDYPLERVLTVDDLRILVIHSHQCNYLNRYEKLTALGKEKHCQLVCFGHTHVWHYSSDQGVTLLNPGSAWLNRNGDRPSYALVEYDGSKLKVTKKTVKN